MSDVEFTYRLTGSGWADCHLSIDQAGCAMTASYLDDALRHLIEATIRMLNGSHEARSSFAEEPGEYRWVFSQTGSEGLVSIEILWFDDWPAMERAVTGRNVFSGRCRLDRFAKALARASAALLEQHGMDGYRRLWCTSDFPTAPYLELCRLLAVRPHRSVAPLP